MTAIPEKLLIVSCFIVKPVCLDLNNKVHGHPKIGSHALLLLYFLADKFLVNKCMYAYKKNPTKINEKTFMTACTYPHKS